METKNFTETEIEHIVHGLNLQLINNKDLSDDRRAFIKSLKNKIRGKKDNNHILVQIKDDEGLTITTFRGEPYHAELLKDFITNIFENEGGGITIWIELYV